jgi:mono/diheme cytochrome c family protein
MNNSFKFIAFILSLAIIQGSCDDTPYVQGEYLYNTKCANCHMSDGAGLGGMIPELYQLTTAASQQTVCTILNGRRDTLWSDKSFLVKEMPAFRNLTATEVSNILNYINHKWTKDFRESTILNVQDYITNCNPAR